VISEASAAYWRAWKAARAATAMAMTEVVTVAALLTVTGTSTLATEGAVIVRAPAAGTVTPLYVLLSPVLIAVIWVTKSAADFVTLSIVTAFAALA